jgi:excisionase family DNA binding protein
MTVETTKRVPRLPFVTIPEVARRRGVSRVAVLYAIRSGRLRAYRDPHRRDWLIKRSDAEVYVDSPVRGRSAAA